MLVDGEALALPARGCDLLSWGLLHFLGDVFDFVRFGGALRAGQWTAVGI